jgi:DNA (cytosine-5)-methyltransferase 1
LWFEYLRLINEIKPRWVIIENVARLVENGLDIVLQGLSEAGYDAEWSVIEATHVGLPHRRERIYIVANLRGLRQHECHIKDGSIQTNTKWEIAQTYHKGEERKSQPLPVCPIFSSRAFDSFRDSNPGRQSALSELRRVTNGIPEGLDERRRKARVKQLGNSIVPQIVEIIGHEILIRESIIKERCKGL